MYFVKFWKFAFGNNQKIKLCKICQSSTCKVCFAHCKERFTHKSFEYQILQILVASRKRFLLKTCALNRFLFLFFIFLNNCVLTLKLNPQTCNSASKQSCERQLKALKRSIKRALKEFSFMDYSFPFLKPQCSFDKNLSI